MFLYDAVGLFGTVLADVAADARDKESHLPLIPSAEITYFLHYKL
jgi:hypothetical protein